MLQFSLLDHFPQNERFHEQSLRIDSLLIIGPHFCAVPFPVSQITLDYHVFEHLMVFTLVDESLEKLIELLFHFLILAVIEALIADSPSTIAGIRHIILGRVGLHFADEVG